jgi:hypothetical protein
MKNCWKKPSEKCWNIYKNVEKMWATLLKMLTKMLTSLKNCWKNVRNIFKKC